MTKVTRGGHVRMCTNENCKTEHFPRTDPAVIMLVHHGDKCLLGRGKHFPRGMHSTLAGFVLHEARTIPDSGQQFLFHGFRIQVVRRTRNQLTLLRVTPPKAEKTLAGAA